MSRVASRFLVITLSILLANGWLSATPRLASAAAPTELFISQIIEGSSNNKALEIYNGTGAAIDLVAGSYNIQMFFNGSATAGLTINLDGVSSDTLADGEVFVVAQSSANAAILAQADQTNAAGWFNGDDAVVLRKGSTVVDVIGQVGFDPGTEWGTGLASTADNTLRRQADVCSGDSNGGDAFDPSIEWDGFATDDFSGLGAHSTTCTGIGLSINDVSQPESNSGSVGFQFTVTLSAAAGPGGVTFDVDTEDGTAESTASEDYTTTTLVDETIPEGQTSTTFSVPVTGDTVFEPDETFFVNISGVTGASVTDGQGLGTIENDDAGDPCLEAFTPIYSIQGSGPSAAITGTVTTQGVVVGDFEGTSAGSGFFLQDVLGDGMAATSDGIFVFTGSSNLVSAGDVVRVTGFARERFSQTALNGSNSNTSAVTQVLKCGTGSVAATDVNLPFADATFPERYEGMSVRLPQSLVISEYFNYDRFGEIVLALPLGGESRPFTGTAIDEPGAAANARTLANSLSRITLDDNQSAQNPPVLRHPNGLPFTLANRFRGGDHVQNTVGVLGFEFSLYRVYPTAGADYSADNPRTAAPGDPGGSLRVAAMNTLNFFVTADYPTGDPLDNKCGPANNVECRGWDFDQPTEFTRQRDKLIEALAGLDADVLGLNELENTNGVEPLESIVSELPGYAYIDTGTIGTDAIKVGLIYRLSVVSPVGDFQVLDSTDDPRFLDTKSRPALAQTFEEIATGARFTVVVNHLKSKGSACDDVGDPDLLDGQGNCSQTRKAAAQALVDWLATDPTGSGDPDFLIMGDLNSYAQEESIDAIKAGSDDVAGTADDYTNLVAHFVGTYAYSYVFDGQAGYLDHALAGATLFPQVAGTTEWHINADEPDVFDYDTSFKPLEQEALYELNAYRTSDHDPVLVGLNLVNDAPTAAITAGSSCSTTGGTFTLVVDDTEQTPGDLTLSVVANTNPSLVPDAGVSFDGAGANRTISITPVSKQSGTAVLTIGVNDGFQTTTATITVRVGSDADETLTGTEGADLILGRQGIDSLIGLGGADVLCGGQGTDDLAGGGGNDALEGQGGADTLSGGEGADALFGGNGDDSLAGNEGDDTLTGGAGADAFSGGDGADTNTDVTPGQGDTWDGT